MKGRDFILLGCSPFFNGGFVNKVFTQIFRCVFSCIETLMRDYRSVRRVKQVRNWNRYNLWTAFPLPSGKIWKETISVCFLRGGGRGYTLPHPGPDHIQTDDIHHQFRATLKRSHHISVHMTGGIGLNTLMTPRYLNLFLDVRLATFHLSPQILTPTLPFVTCGLMRKNVKIWSSIFWSISPLL